MAERALAAEVPADANARMSSLAARLLALFLPVNQLYVCSLAN